MKIHRLTVFAVFILILATKAPAGEEASDLNLLKTLRPVHPRLLVLDQELPAIKDVIKSDPLAGELEQKLLAEGEALLKAPPLHYEITGVEHTLLGTSRSVEGRVWLLAGLYRLNGDRRFAARARDEMLAAAQFPDWYPKHFLDTGEMTAALGLGYDWLYDFLSPEDRAAIRQGMIRNGIEPGIKFFSPGGHGVGLHNNWVQVCCGGLTIGALAIADEEPAKAATILQLTRGPMKKIMQLFAPDGGFEEGPAYWDYATSYNVFYLAALESALGTNFGLSKAKGFADTGNYRMQIIGPIGMAANFGDAGEEVEAAPQMFWMAKKFDHPEYARHERSLIVLKTPAAKRREPYRFSIFDLLWMQPAAVGEQPSQPAGANFHRIAAAFFRSGWESTNAIYLAFKGGNNHASHGHLDLGTFILDAFGQRWAADLGGDSYGLPGYFGAQRWGYYRARTEGHNTLTINNHNEDLDAEAPLVEFSSAPDRSFAVTDLKAAYAHELAGWQRGIMLLNHRQVVVQDEVSPLKAVDLTWNFHTRATIEIAANGTEAILSQGDSRLRARILSPGNAKFEELAVNPPAPQRPAPGVSNLIIRLPQAEAPTTITVLFEAPDENVSAPAIIPLPQWRIF